MDFKHILSLSFSFSAVKCPLLKSSSPEEPGVPTPLSSFERIPCSADYRLNSFFLWTGTSSLQRRSQPPPLAPSCRRCPSFSKRLPNSPTSPFFFFFLRVFCGPRYNLKDEVVPGPCYKSPVAGPRKAFLTTSSSTYSGTTFTR